MTHNLPDSLPLLSNLSTPIHDEGERPYYGGYSVELADPNINQKYICTFCSGIMRHPILLTLENRSCETCCAYSAYLCKLKHGYVRVTVNNTPCFLNCTERDKGFEKELDSLTIYKCPLCENYNETHTIKDQIQHENDSHALEMPERSLRDHFHITGDFKDHEVTALPPTKIQKIAHPIVQNNITNKLIKLTQAAICRIKKNASTIENIGDEEDRTGERSAITTIYFFVKGQIALINEKDEVDKTASEKAFSNKAVLELENRQVEDLIRPVSTRFASELRQKHPNLI